VREVIALARRLLNQSTHESVAYSTASVLPHGPSRRDPCPKHFQSWR
jgi:hypothetical protein